MFQEQLATINGEFEDNRYKYGSEITKQVMDTNNTALIFGVQAVDFPLQALTVDLIYRRSGQSYLPNYDVLILRQEMGSDEQGFEAGFRYYLPYGVQVSTGGGLTQKISDENFKTTLVRGGIGWYNFSRIDLSFAYLYRRMGIEPEDFDVHSTWTDIGFRISRSLDFLMQYRTSLSREGNLDFFGHSVTASLSFEPVQYAELNFRYSQSIPKMYFQNATWPPDNGIMIEAVVHTTVFNNSDE
ncbi:MAG: hypothetical protein KKH98_12460 [Spirochaetes bacterium]|nr:hypothetical protein [Spirochaetota bacterium]